MGAQQVATPNRREPARAGQQRHALTRRREEIRDFALRFLTGKAREVEARAALARYLDAQPAIERHRAEATFAVLRWGSREEIQAGVARLFAESKPGVVSRAAQALVEKGTEQARSILADLCSRHPVDAVRKALESAGYR